ncbi:MAG: hypothetical protein WCO91_01025 [Gemmataceae bacterium]
MNDTTGQWPQIEDWQAALLEAHKHFLDHDLSGCALERETEKEDSPPLPPLLGDNSVVFRMRARFQKRRAVKLWLRQVQSRISRYGALEAVWPAAPFLAGLRILPEGIRIIRPYPVLDMDFLGGIRLDEFLAKKYLDPTAMDELLKAWFALSAAMEGPGWSHGDLRPDNILVLHRPEDALRLRLVDYDGFFVKDAELPPSGSIGRPDFQHPLRRSLKYEGALADRFPFLLHATAFAAIRAKGGKIWTRHGGGAGTLFTNLDLVKPGRSELLGECMDSKDPDLRVLAEHLVRALSNPIEETPPLDEIGVSWLKKSGGKKGVAHPGASGAKASPTTEKSTVAPVTSLALSSDNKQIAVGNQDGLLRIMDRSGKRTVAKFSDHRSQINALAFSVNGQMVYSAGMDCLVCAFQWVQQESPWHHYAHNHSTTCLAVDRMGEYFLSGGGDGTIVLRTLETLKDSEPLKAHRGRVSACAFLGNLVVTTGLDDGKVATWQTKGLTPLAKADFHGDCIIDMDANAYVKLIALSVSSRRIGFFEPNTLKRSPLKIDTLVTVHSLRFSPKGTYLAGGCADGSVRVWHTQSGKLVGYQMVHAKKPILAVIWLAGGSGLLVGTNDGQVKKYSLGWLRFCAFFRPKESEQPGSRH